MLRAPRPGTLWLCCSWENGSVGVSEQCWLFCSRVLHQWRFFWHKEYNILCCRHRHKHYATQCPWYCAILSSQKVSCYWNSKQHKLNVLRFLETLWPLSVPPNQNGYGCKTFYLNFLCHRVDLSYQLYAIWQHVRHLKQFIHKHLPYSFECRFINWELWRCICVCIRRTIVSPLDDISDKKSCLSTLP
jgi:hypothetical protein